MLLVVCSSIYYFSRPNGKDRCRMSGLVVGRGLTTGRHGSVSLDVGGGLWGGRAQGQQVAAGGSMSVSWAGPEM